MQIHAFINKQLFLLIYVVFCNLKHSLLNCYKYNVLTTHELTCRICITVFTPLLRHVLYEPLPSCSRPVNVNPPIDFF